VVLVHANISDHRSWDPLLSALRERHRVIAYSRRYHGPNAPIAADSKDLWANDVEDLAQIITTLGPAPAHLVGNSAGAVVAILLALRRPELVRSLVLEEPPLMTLFTSYPPRAGELARLLFSRPAVALGVLGFGARAIGPAIAAFRLGRDAAGLRYFSAGVLGAGPPQDLTPERLEQMRQNLAPHRAAMLGEGLPQFTPADARSVKTPTLLLHGEQTATYQRHILEELARLLPDAELRPIPRASHFVHEDNPPAVAAALLAFFARHRG